MPFAIISQLGSNVQMGRACWGIKLFMSNWLGRVLGESCTGVCEC